MSSDTVGGCCEQSGDDGEVEYAPGVAPEAPAVEEKTQADLHHEDSQDATKDADSPVSVRKGGG